VRFAWFLQSQPVVRLMTYAQLDRKLEGASARLHMQLREAVHAESRALLENLIEVRRTRRSQSVLRAMIYDAQEDYAREISDWLRAPSSERENTADDVLSTRRTPTAKAIAQKMIVLGSG
jgi:hypothetical protein